MFENNGKLIIYMKKYKQEGQSGPESLTSLYYVHRSYKLMRHPRRPILAPGALFEQTW